MEGLHPDVPDMSHGDYYCRVCDSHMNASLVWEAHVTGKKHMKNVKKGATESRYEEPLDPESSVKYELRNVKDPVVGLSYMHEIRKKERHVPPTFTCFLCHASLASVPLVIEHLISMKHRLNYIQVRDPDQFRLIQSTNLKKDAMEPLVTDAARKLEQEYGRGTVKVKQERRNPVQKLISFDDEDDNSNQNSRFDANESSKNSHDTEERRRERSRSKSRGREVDRYASHHRRSRSRSRNRELEDRYGHRRSPREDSYLNRRRSRSPREDSYLTRRRSPREDSYIDRHRNRSPREDSYMDRHRNRSPREDSYIDHQRDRSPRNDFEKMQSSYFDEELSSSSRRSFSKRELSPYQDAYERHRSFSKRDASPKHDYNRDKSFDDYARSSKNNDVFDSASSRNHRTNSQERIEKRYNSPDRHKSNSSSFLPQEKHLPSVSKQSEQKTLVQIAIEGVKQLSLKDAQKALEFLMQNLPKVDSVDKIIMLAAHARYSQQKLEKSPIFQEYIKPYLQAQNSGSTNSGMSNDVSSYMQQTGVESLLSMLNRSSANNGTNVPFQQSSPYVPTTRNISSQQPGNVSAYQGVPYPRQAQNVGSAMNVPRLDSNVSSSVNQNVRSDAAQKSIDAENFINSIFKRAADLSQMQAQAPYQPSTSYASTQQPGFVNTFQARPGNQSTSANPYQGVPGQKQVPYQQQNTRFPTFPPSQPHNYPSKY